MFEVAFSAIGSQGMGLLTHKISAQKRHYKLGSWTCFDCQISGHNKKNPEFHIKSRPINRSTPNTYESKYTREVDRYGSLFDDSGVDRQLSSQEFDNPENNW